jgi:hypothetical protein
MEKYYVKIPNENCKVIDFIQDDFSGIAFINVSLKRFEPKIVFSWHFSIMIELKDCEDDGLPNSIAIIQQIENDLRSQINEEGESKPNGLFLARIFWNHTCELIWKIHNPDVMEEHLKKIINNNLWKNAFDYRIDNDENWKLSEWHLSN